MLEPGTRIDKYEIVAPIAAGGMGVVYQGRHAMLGRDVAIKMLSDIYTFNEKVRHRFRQEAYVQSQLKHPYVVEVLDFVAQGQLVALVMELIVGPTLESVMTDEVNGPWSLADAMGVFIPIAEGVGYAHKRGVVHRDIKPGNVLLDRSEGGVGVPKVTDFGLAKVLSDTEKLTKTGARMGTLPYMAPEQFSGAADLGKQADVFALGILLWRLLAGKLPVDAENMLQVVEFYTGKHQGEDLRIMRPDLPSELHDILEATLRRDPAERMPDAITLKEALAVFDTRSRRLEPLTHTLSPVDFLSDDPADSGSHQGFSAPTTTATGDGVPNTDPDDAPALRRRRGRRVRLAFLVLGLLIALGAIVVMATQTPPDTRADSLGKKGDKGAVIVRTGSSDAQTPPVTPGPVVVPGRRATPPAAVRRTGDVFALALAYDFKQGVRADPRMVQGLYMASCRAGDKLACRYKDWHRRAGADRAAALTIFSSSCAAGASREACLATAWILTQDPKNQRPSAGAPNPTKGYGILVKMCEKEFGPACVEQARLLEVGVGTGKDRGTAITLFTQACERNPRYGCRELGTATMQGAGVSQDVNRALALFDKGCRAGDPHACFEQARAYELGAGAAPSSARAIPLYDRACQDGVVPACYGLGDALRRLARSADEHVRGIGAFADGCRLGHLVSCGKLGRAYVAGKYVRRDVAKARALYEKACEGGVWAACSDAALGYGTGKSGFPKDRKRGIALLRRACGGKYYAACVALGTAHQLGKGVSRSYVRARTLFKGACDAEHFAGCAALGNLYALERSGFRDLNKAKALYAKACEGGSLRGCVYLGNLYVDGAGVKRNPGKAVKLFRDSCTAGEMRGCTRLGLLFAYGDGVTKRPDEAAKLYGKACEGRYGEGCFFLGLAYGAGKGVTKDRMKAKGFFRRACKLGYDRGCTAAR